MISTTEARRVLGSGGQVVDEQGNKIGKIGQVFLDDGTSEPAWITVRTGLFGGAESFVPLEQATRKGDNVVVPFDKATIKDAPRVEDADSHLEPDEEDALYRYYGLGARPDGDAPSSTPSTETSTESSTDTTPIPTTGGTTRTVEEIDPGTTSPTPGRRLRRYVVTEEVPESTPTESTTTSPSSTDAGTDGTHR